MLKGSAHRADPFCMTPKPLPQIRGTVIAAADGRVLVITPYGLETRTVRVVDSAS